MKLLKIFCLFILILTSCTENNRTTLFNSDGLWVIDVTKEYPIKEMYIQDIADVDYIPLETNDSMLWKRREIIYLDENYIVGAFDQTGILIHDNRGKAIRSFSRKGNGPEEYSHLTLARYFHDDIYIHDMLRSKYYIYDNNGNFKRSFNSAVDNVFESIYNFFVINDDELIGYNKYSNAYRRLFTLSGEHLGDIILKGADSTLTLSYRKNDMMFNMSVSNFIKDENGYIITSFPSDTIYHLSPDLKLTPIGIRFPSVSTMEIPVFLIPFKNTSRYFIMYTIKKEDRFPIKPYILDKQNSQLYHLKNYFKNKDYIDQAVHLDMYGPAAYADFPHNTCVQSILAEELCKAYEEGKLSGKLKDTASNLKEDDNPVLMIIKFRE